MRDSSENGFEWKNITALEKKMAELEEENIRKLEAKKTCWEEFFVREQ